MNGGKDMVLDVHKNITYSDENIFQIKIVPDHELLELKRKLNFEKIINILKENYLKKNVGDQIDFDHHARALLLQLYTGETYRGLVDQLNSNIYFRIFMNFDINDRARDHSAYVKFSNALSPEAMEELNLEIIHIAMLDGHIGDSIAELDSTIKEANITYPTDGKNLKTLLLMILAVTDYLKDRGYEKEANEILKNIDHKLVLKLLKGYFFEKKNKKK